MIHFEIIAPLLPVDDPGATLNERLVKTVMDAIPDDLRAAMACGCQIETTLIGENTIKICSKYPISILKNKAGEIIDVYELKDGNRFKRFNSGNTPPVA